MYQFYVNGVMCDKRASRRCIDGSLVQPDPFAQRKCEIPFPACPEDYYNLEKEEFVAGLERFMGLGFEFEN